MNRVQTGVRIEKGLLKVLKAVAEYEEVSLGVLLEKIVLSSFAGGMAFDRDTRDKIAELSRVYGLEVETVGAPEESPASDVSESPQVAAAPDPQDEAREADLAEAFDGLSRMLGEEP